MRWLPFTIFAYIVLGVQLGIADLAEVGSSSARPNFVLIAVVFVVLNAMREPALLASIILGAMQDLVAQQPFGLYAFSYGITAFCLTGATGAVYRDHPLTHFGCVLFGGFVTAIVLTVHEWIHPAGIGVLALFASALYSAILAPLLLWPLQKSRHIFGFQAARRSIRAW